MGTIVRRTGGIKTVGELMYVLAGFDDDLRLDRPIEVYQVKADPGDDDTRENDVVVQADMGNWEPEGTSNG